MSSTEIRQIQEFLKIPETGTFDEFTEAAIRNFQQKNKLPVTGLLDSATKELIKPINASISTDRLEKVEPIKVKVLKLDEYFKTNEKKEWLFLHHTAGNSDPNSVINGWETDQRGKVGTQFVIGGRNIQTLDEQYDGDIYQCMPDYICYGWHLGIGNTLVHRASIGIELCNFGWLTKDGNDFRTYPILDSTGKLVRKGVIAKPSEIVDLKREFRGYRYFHKYSDNQLTALKYLIEKIGRETGIDVTQGLKQRLKSNKDPFIAFDYDPNVVNGKVKGLFCHTNVSPKNKWNNYEKWDLYPADNVIEMILSL